MSKYIITESSIIQEFLLSSNDKLVGSLNEREGYLESCIHIYYIRKRLKNKKSRLNKVNSKGEQDE